MKTLTPFAKIALCELTGFLLYLGDAPLELFTPVAALAILGELHYGHGIYQSWKKSGVDFLPFLRSNASFFSHSPDPVAPRIGEPLAVLIKP